MTFRPSDDVLDEIANGQQPASSLDQYNFWNQEDWQHMFNNSDDLDGNWTSENAGINSPVIDIPVEEVKAPDLSELLKDGWENNVLDENVVEQPEVNISNVKIEEQQVESLNSSVENVEGNEMLVENRVENKVENNQSDKVNPIQNVVDSVDPNKMSDVDRSAMVSSIQWSINSNLDFLVDESWLKIIEKYRVLNRLFFKWWAFVLALLIGVLSWVFLQVKANRADDIQMLNDSSIKNKSRRIEETSDKILLPVVDSGVDVDVMVPYWSSSFNWTFFNSKSNLLSYKWLILPQLSSVNYKVDDFISLQDFTDQKLTRQDIKNLMNSLISNDSIYRNTRDLPNVVDYKWIGNVFQWSLVDGFNLWCLNNDKVSNFVCDKFLDTFYNYGKYYDLTQYSSEILDLVIKLLREGKDINPVCDMVKEYTLHAGVTSDSLISVMGYCNEDDVKYYRKMVNFIDLENSLSQPELSSKVFDDPDLNAYKLLSAQQSVYKILDGTSLNENYIKSYLKFVQSLIDKDKWTNRYLKPIYKDLLYVFNMDELNQKLMQKWKLSSDIKLQIDQINNWNALWSTSLLSQLTTSDIVQIESDYTGIVVEQRSMDDLFAQYYAMTDRLRVRKVDVVSDDEIKVQTELFNDGILQVTEGETLKVTVVLRRQDNLLYVDSIKVANQSQFTDILNIYLSEWDVTFYAILNYIDEQVWMWYKVAPEDIEQQPTFCEEIMKRSDIAIYNCDDSSISLYKWEVEYNFVLTNWVLDSFTISDKNLDQIIKTKLDWVLFMKDSTPSIITSIIDFSVEVEDETIEKRLEIMNQFRIHFKLVPDDIRNIEWKTDEFLIDFTLWEFKLQAHYDINTHLLTKISYTNCDKPLEIRQLSLEITAENEPQLIEILNNPRVFFAKINPTVYKRYQKVCGEALSKK